MIPRQAGWICRRLAGLAPRNSEEELWRLRRMLKQPRHQRGRIRFQGQDLVYVDPLSCFYQIHELFVEGCYDFTSDRPSPRVIDCGGNIGLSVRRFRELYPKAKITVLEADPNIAEVLTENLQLAKDNGTELIRAAAWSSDGQIRFNSAGADEGAIARDGNVSVPARDIAALCNERVDMLKIDVEGAEYELLKRLIESRTIQNVQRIACELHDRGDGPPQMHAFLASLADSGYRYELVGGRSSPEMNPAESRSGFAAARYRGNLAMVYAWRPAA